MPAHLQSRSYQELFSGRRIDQWLPLPPFLRMVEPLLCTYVGRTDIAAPPDNHSPLLSVLGIGSRGVGSSKRKGHHTHYVVSPHQNTTALISRSVTLQPVIVCGEFLYRAFLCAMYAYVVSGCHSAAVPFDPFTELLLLLLLTLHYVRALRVKTTPNVLGHMRYNFSL